MQPRAEFRLTRLTTPVLDLLRFSCTTITHDGMHLGSADPEVGAGLVWTGYPLGRAVLGRSPTAFDLPPGTRLWQASSPVPLQSKQPDNTQGNRAGSVAADNGERESSVAPERRKAGENS
jgi:hypothetical protein